MLECSEGLVHRGAGWLACLVSDRGRMVRRAVCRSRSRNVVGIRGRRACFPTFSCHLWGTEQIYYGQGARIGLTRRTRGFMSGFRLVGRSGLMDSGNETRSRGCGSLQAGGRCFLRTENMFDNGQRARIERVAFLG